MTLNELEGYLTHILPKKFDDSATFTLDYPLNYNADCPDIALKEQIKGYESLYLYLKEKDKPFTSSNFYGFLLNAHLIQAIEFNCPSAYCVLIAEAIKKINSLSCDFDAEQIGACFALIDKSISLFGALGHYFGLRLSLQLGHYYFSQRNKNSFYSRSETNKNAHFYYEICANHFEKFLTLIKDQSHQAIFKNAFMGKEINELFYQQTRCSINSFSGYLLKYYSKVSETDSVKNFTPLTW